MVISEPDFEVIPRGYEQLKDGRYRFQVRGMPFEPPTSTIAIAFDHERGILLRHGSPEFIQSWMADYCAQQRAEGFGMLADSVSVSVDQLPLDELNRCLVDIFFCRERLRGLRSETTESSSSSSSDIVVQG